MVMVLPFVLGLLAGLLAYAGQRRAAIGFCLVTVIVQVWWFLFHATSKLGLSL